MVLLGLDFGCCGATLGLEAAGLDDCSPRFNV